MSSSALSRTPITTTAVRAFGYTPNLTASSTDANIISLGIPAVTISAGGLTARGNSLDEWVDMAKPETLRGNSAGLAAVLATAGF